MYVAIELRPTASFHTLNTWIPLFYNISMTLPIHFNLSFPPFLALNDKSYFGVIHIMDHGVKLVSTPPPLTLFSEIRGWEFHFFSTLQGKT